MKERPKIDFLKMSHPQFDSWEIFAKQCYAHMDHIEQENKELREKIDSLYKEEAFNAAISFAECNNNRDFQDTKASFIGGVGWFKNELLNK